MRQSVVRDLSRLTRTKTPRCPKRAARIVRPRPQQDTRIATLDLLRLGAALVVVLFHYGYRGAAGTAPMMAIAFPELAPIAKYGFLGVDLFFLISGFVIAASAEGRTAVQFAIARAGRLYPAFLVAMTLTAVVLVACGELSTNVIALRWLANLTMVAPALGQPFMDGAYWSIVLELVFYGWIAVLILAGVFPRHTRTIVAVWLAISAVNELTLQLKPLRILLLTEYGPLFASGVLMHLMWKGDRSLATRALLATAFVLGLIHSASVESTFARLYQDGIDDPTLWALHAGIYLLFWGALLASRIVRPTPVVLALGGLTYPLYLVHQEAGYALIAALAPSLGRWPALVLVIALALSIAWLVWRHAEPPGRKLVVKGLRHLLTVWPTAPRQVKA